MATTPANTGVDWTLVVNITIPLLSAAIGALITKVLERRPKLVSFIGHVSTFRASPPNVQPFLVYTHTVIIRNSGRSVATNVRVTHKTLPDVNVFPPIQYTVEELPGGSRDIVIPRLVAGQQIVLSYMYVPPLTAGDVHAGVASDQGFAKELNVLLQPVAPRWFLRGMMVLLIVGAVTLLYLAWLGVRHMLA
jgi:hypothetical protein